jgi:site-specific DNA recombinase
MTQPQNTALIYCRVSTAGQEQDGTSLDTQETACRAYAEEHGYHVAHVYHETYSGAELHDRPALNRLRDAVRAGGVGAVIIYALDRLTRGQGLTAYLLDEFERRGCALLSVTDPLDATREGKLIVGIKEYVAEVEREKIRERTLRGKKAKAAQGQLCNGGIPLYGYRIDPDTRRRVIDEPEAAIVRDVFRRAAEGVSLGAIARGLTADGVPIRATGKIAGRQDHHLCNPRGAWGRSSVTAIVTNPSYKGETTYLGVTMGEDVTPAIVDAALWEAAQARPAPNGPTAADAARNETRPHLLRGLIYCARCGARMRPVYIDSRGRKTGTKYPGRTYYRCRSAIMVRGRCGALGVRADLVEPWAWEQIEAVLRDPALIAAEIERQREDGADVQAVEELEAATRQLAECERQEARLLDLYARGDDALPLEAITVKLRDLGRQRAVCQQAAERARQRLAQVERTQQELASLSRYVERVARKLEGFDFAQRRLALEALGARVIADGRDWRLDCAIDLTQGVEDRSLAGPARSGRRQAHPGGPGAGAPAE